MEMSDNFILLYFCMEKDTFQLLVNEVRDYHEFFKGMVHMEFFITERHPCYTSH